MGSEGHRLAATTAKPSLLLRSSVFCKSGPGSELELTSEALDGEPPHTNGGIRIGCGAAYVSRAVGCRLVHALPSSVTEESLDEFLVGQTCVLRKFFLPRVQAVSGGKLESRTWRANVFA